MRILAVVLFLWAAVSSAQLPRIDVSADFDSAGNPSAKFAINTKQFNMPTIRLYPYKAGSAWSPTGLVWYMSYGRNNSVTNLITIGPGSVSSTYVDFSPSATTFAQTVNNGYAVFSCQATNGQPVSFADGSITIERAPEMFVGNNILLGSTTGTGPVNWSLFSHYLGTWPFYGGSNTDIGYTSTGIVINTSVNTNYFNSIVVAGSNIIVGVVTSGQDRTYTVHSSGGGTITNATGTGRLALGVNNGVVTGTVDVAELSTSALYQVAAGTAVSVLQSAGPVAVVSVPYLPTLSSRVDAVDTLLTTGFYSRVQSLALFATGTPLYVEADAAAIAQIGVASNALNTAVTNDRANSIAADAALTSSVLSLTASLGVVSNIALTASNQAALAQAWAQAGSNLAASLSAMTWITNEHKRAFGYSSIYRDEDWSAYSPTTNDMATLAMKVQNLGYGNYVRYGFIDLWEVQTGVSGIHFRVEPYRGLSVFGATNGLRYSSVSGEGTTRFVTEKDAPYIAREASFRIVSNRLVEVEAYTNQTVLALAWAQAGSNLAAGAYSSLSNNMSIVLTGKLDNTTAAATYATTTRVESIFNLFSTQKLNEATAVLWSNSLSSRIVVLETGAATKVEAAALWLYATNNSVASWTTNAVTLASNSTGVAISIPVGNRATPGFSASFMSHDLVFSNIFSGAATNVRMAAALAAGTPRWYSMFGTSMQEFYGAWNLSPSSYQTISGFNSWVTNAVKVFLGAPTSNTMPGSVGHLRYDHTNLYLWHQSSSKWLRVTGTLEW